MSFTFTNNRTHPIAEIKSGKRTKHVYLTPEEKMLELPEEEGESSIVDEELTPLTVEQITSALSRGLTLREVYSMLEGSAPAPRSSFFKEYELEPSESIEVLPSPQTERVFVAGESGCGKSTICANYARQYLKMYPQNKVFMFLRQEDPAYENIPRMEFSFTPPENEEDVPKWEEDMDSIIRGEITLDQLENSLVILDDMDNVQDKKLLTQVHKLVNDIFTNGRKRNIYVIYCSHLLMNYGQTRVVLNEANKVFFFPGCGTRQIENFLKTYGSMKNKQAEALASIKSRWVMLSRRVPRYIIHARGMFML